MLDEETPAAWASRHRDGRYRITRTALHHARRGVVALESQLAQHPIPNAIHATGLWTANDLLAHTPACPALRRWDAPDHTCTHPYCPLATFREVPA